MDFPSIPKIDGATELLEMLLDPKKTAERLKAIEDATEIHNKRLERWSKFKTVEQYKSQVDTEVATARQEIENAKEYATRTRKAADALLTKASAKDSETSERLNKREIYLHNWSEKVALQEQEVIKREAAVGRDMAEVAKTKEYAERLSKEANQIKAEYEAKLARVKELAA